MPPGRRHDLERAPSARLPRVTASKQKRSASRLDVRQRADLEAHRAHACRGVAARRVLDDLAARLRRAPSHAWPTSMSAGDAGIERLHRERAWRGASRRSSSAAMPASPRASAPRGWKFHSVGATIR